MSKYGVLLIGGMRTHQENHAEIFAANPHCRLVAAADESNIPAWISKLNEDLAMVHGIPYIPDLDKALARDDIDIVSATPQVERRGRIGVSSGSPNTKHTKNNRFRNMCVSTCVDV